jgi:general stress protein YciG
MSGIKGKRYIDEDGNEVLTGGLKAAKTNKLKYGKDFYARIGAKGGRNGHTGGFAANPALARVVGALGGKKSRRTGVKNGEGKNSLKDIEEIERVLEEESGRDK